MHHWSSGGAYEYSVSGARSLYLICLFTANIRGISCGMVSFLWVWFKPISRMILQIAALFVKWYWLRYLFELLKCFSWAIKVYFLALEGAISRHCDNDRGWLIDSVMLWPGTGDCFRWLFLFVIMLYVPFNNFQSFPNDSLSSSVEPDYTAEKSILLKDSTQWFW